jgi:hypothetical protein
VPGDGRAADRQRVGDLADRARTGAEQFDDGPPVRIAERLERIGDPATVTELLPSRQTPLDILGRIDGATKGWSARG